MQGATRFIVWGVGGKRIFFARLLLFLALSAAVYPLHARRDQYGTEPEYYDFDESLVEKWKESEVILPPYPRDQDLLAVPLLSTDTLKIYIDRASLSRGADRVARFSLVVESPSGARSVFHDGLRCETREYKTYAIGSPEHVFTPVKDAAWRRIPQPAMNAFRYHLYRHYICDTHASARTPEDLVRLLIQ
ncbi:MAG: CNP1-like family protein [Gammaproteobacteria bacterium]|nr:CNP1-like family protein [Gammaproteobacteria bacterium]